MRKLISLLFTYISAITLHAQNVATYSKEDGNKIIGNHIEHLEDKNSNLELHEVINSRDFTRSDRSVPNYGISNSTHWIRVNIANNTNDSVILLEFRQPIIDFVALYDITDKDSPIKLFEGGDGFKFEQRQIKNPSYFFKLSIEPTKTKSYLLQIKSGEQILGLLVLSDYESAYNYISITDILFGIYVGILLTMFLYNFFLYTSIKERVYLIYVFYILFIGLTQLSLFGYTFQFLWPNSPYIANLAPYLFSCLVSITAIFFMREFLQTKARIPKFNIVSHIIQWAYIITFTIVILGFYNLGYFLVLGLAGTVSFYMLIAGYLVLKTGYKPAKFYILAWSTLLVGIILFVMKDFNLLPNNLITSYTMPAGSALEVILLSFALADRINILKKEKEESQIIAIKAAQENERLVKEQNVILEQKVEERTTELQEALNTLKNAQANLVEAEKMASLGQLTAGIAHEINNPINFVSSNIYPLKLDFEDIISVIEAYDKLKEGNSPEDVLKQVEEVKQNIDFEYVKNEIQQLLRGIEDGAQRTFEIVQGLKNFSYLDEADHKPANLNDGIKSTLVLLQNAINGEIEVEADYGDLPLVECFPGKMNQVFMNILSNAIQAIKSKPALDNEKIIIKTYVEGNWVKIVFSDTGPGIPEEIRGKVFDPFFTTKDVGQGTGLGLSIVYNIIKKHDGTITVDSKVGKGTTFTISLPLSQNGEVS